MGTLAFTQAPKLRRGRVPIASATVLAAQTKWNNCLKCNRFYASIFFGQRVYGRLSDLAARLSRLEDLGERPARALAGGVAVIRVGGATEVEVKERKDRVDDAMHATRAAVEEGILPGGGVALLRSVKALGRLKTENHDRKTGIDIVRKAVGTAARNRFIPVSRLQLHRRARLPTFLRWQRSIQ